MEQGRTAQPDRSIQGKDKKNVKYFIRTCFILKKYIIFVETFKQNNMQSQEQLLLGLHGSDLESWILVQRAYQEFAQREDIMECGFNKMSGYVYIALENGVQIASCFGNPVEYIVYQHEQDEEEFFDTYTEAINSIN